MLIDGTTECDNGGNNGLMNICFTFFLGSALARSKARFTRSS